MLDFLMSHWYVTLSLIVNEWRQMRRWRYSGLVLGSRQHEQVVDAINYVLRLNKFFILVSIEERI